MKQRLKTIFPSISNLQFSEEGKDYESCKFTVEEYFFLGRKSKITPTKKGEFVTLWKRLDKDTHPFEQKDKIDYVFIVNQNATGYFLFPQAILLEKGIFQSSKKKGKRGFRLYFPWEEDLNPQAKKTRSWQEKYFHTLS